MGMTDPESTATLLAADLLKAFRLALESRHQKVAEFLLCAMEELVRDDPARQGTLDEAYLALVR